MSDMYTETRTQDLSSCAMLGGFRKPYAHCERAIAAVPEFIDYIANDTGWRLNSDKLNFEIVDSKSFIKMVIDDFRIRQNATTLHTTLPQGTTSKPLELWNTISNQVQKNMLTKLVPGVFLPSINSVVMNADTLNQCNEDFLRKLIFHELVHAAQYQEHPSFFTSIANLNTELRSLTTPTNGHHNLSALKDLSDTITARMSWIEGQPTLLQRLDQYERFPEPEYRYDLETVFASVSALASPTFSKKLKQYKRGGRVFESLYTKDDGSQLIDECFQNPQLVDVLLKTQGTVHFTLPTGADQTSIAHLKHSIATCKSLNPKGSRRLSIFINDTQI
jgi:hypothetical protein